MTLSPFMREVYASAPTDTRIIHTLELRLPQGVTLRYALGYSDETLGVDGVMQVFQAAQMDLALPTREAGGNQTIRFAVGVVDSEPYRLISEALATGLPAFLIYREYTNQDRTEPGFKQAKMLIKNGGFSGNALTIDASYYDFLNTAWPRERYTAESAPGVKYL